MSLKTSSPNLFNAAQYYNELDEAVAAMATAADEDRGAIFTKPSVATFILDLVDYTVDRALHDYRLLEPAAGTGAILLPAIDRLLLTWSQSPEADPATLAPCIRAVELHQKSFQSLKEKIFNKLATFGLTQTTADFLCDTWLIQGDFLLTKHLGGFDFVVGNPPYVRQEKISPVLLATYQAKYKTLYDRADLYVPFYERSLKLLRPHGTLSFICTDRWTKNKYGAPLRRLVAKDYHLKTYVDLVGAQAFTTDVATYPAITVIQKSKKNITRFLTIQEITAANLQKAASQLSKPDLHDSSAVIECTNVVNGAQPWVIGAAPDLQLVRQLEQRFPPLEAAGCKVAIGVATGADKIFIADYAQLDVEEARKLPLATTKDLLNSGIKWQGRGILNPYEADGTLADLDAYPRFKAYVLKHQKRLAARHVAKKSPAKWYKTIDRIYPELAIKPKLLIPDIKGHAAIVYENEGLYPHHNLYYLTSDTWDLRALQSVLRSGIAELFVSTYSTRMRGGYIRYQAQYLRRIRVPEWNNIPTEARALLIKASENGNFSSCQALVFDLYGLTQRQRELITSKQQ